MAMVMFGSGGGGWGFGGGTGTGKGNGDTLSEQDKNAKDQVVQDKPPPKDAELPPKKTALKVEVLGDPPPADRRFYRVEGEDKMKSLPEVMAITFIALVLIQFFNAYNCRSDRLSAFQSPFANRWLNMAVAWEMVLLVAIVYTPFLQGPFATYSLSSGDWFLAAAGAFTVVPAVETVKWMARRGSFGALR